MKTFSEELVSVIVPVYNEERYLKACIQSIRNQTYRNLEIVLVDDGSTNSAGGVCDNFAELDDRISVIHKKNGGLSAARYDGLMASHGTWIMFVDNDDMISPYMIATFSSFFEDDELDIITGEKIEITDPESYIWKKECDCYNKKTGREICEQFGKDESIVTPLWGKVYRKTYLDHINLEKYRDICPTIFFEDVLMTPFLYYYARQVCMIKNVFYLHREVLDSISRAMSLSPFFYEQVDSAKILLEFYKKVSLKYNYDLQLDKLYRTILRLYCLVDYEKISEEFKMELKTKIVSYYEEYYVDYIHAKEIPKFRKVWMMCFHFNHYFWKKLVCLFYYRKI